MKPLKRPMFRSGGPIKEGIMDGMKTKAALVGDPVFPKAADGRAKHYVNFAIPAFQALRIGAQRAIPKIANFFRTQVGTKGPGTVRIPGAPGTPGRFTTAGSKVAEKSGPSMPIYEPNIAGRIITQDPTFRTGAAIIKGVTSPAVKGPVASVARLVVSPTGALTGLYYANGKFFNKDTNEEVPPPPNADKLKLGDRVGTSGAPGGGDPDMFLAPKEKKLSAAQKDKITKDRIEANRERYYKLMGIDKMNKKAVYDTLIDASTQIREGGNIKDQLKSGSLASSVIQALSKNLDSSVDLKRQIDAAILKGEIEKDIKASDPQAKKRAEYIDKQIALADKQLAGGSLIENIQAGAKAAGGANSTTNVYNSVIKSLQIEPEVLRDTAETIKLRKLDDYTTDEALVKKIVEAENKGPGVYIIDKSVILVDEQGNTRTLALG